MLSEIQKEYLDNIEHSQKSKEKIADYVNEAFIRGSWLAKKINDLKLPGVKGITYRVKSDYSIGAKVRIDKEDWKELSDFIGLSIVAPKSTFEYIPEALTHIKDLDHVSSSCFSYILNYRFMDFPVEIALYEYKDFALKQFNECVIDQLGTDGIYSNLSIGKKLKEAFDDLLDTADVGDIYALENRDKYVKAFEKFLSIGHIIKGFGRFSICCPSDGTNKPLTVNFEDGFACDSAFSLAFLTSPNYSRLLRFGILTNDDTLRDLAFMAYKGVADGIQISYVTDWFRKIQH